MTRKGSSTTYKTCTFAFPRIHGVCPKETKRHRNKERQLSPQMRSLQLPADPFLLQVSADVNQDRVIGGLICHEALLHLECV